jgi:hypothetical protein
VLPGREHGAEAPAWEPTDKVGHAASTFDPEVYRAQLAANEELAELSRAKKFEGARP